VKIVTGDLWDFYGHAVIAVTTCGQVDRRGEAVMLRGCARQSRERFPDLPKRLGSLLLKHGNHVFDLGDGLVSFPVEHDPYGIADPRLIEASCLELVALADLKGWTEIVVPRPGCGGGGLGWGEVRPILERIFDDRFRVIHL